MPALFDRLPALVRSAALCGALALGTGVAAAQGVNSSASYVVSLGGINVASVDVTLVDDGAAYVLDLDATVAGLGSLVASGTASIVSRGRATAPSLTAQRFDLHTRANGEDFRVTIQYGASEVEAFQVEPPLLNNIDRVAIERAHLRQVGDILASFVWKGGALEPALCNRRLQIFTGVERFDLALSYQAEQTATSPRTGYQGPVLLCHIDYRPVSGHFTTSEITRFLADSDGILIWYAPLGETGYFIPYRVLLGTNFGDLSMVLTAMRP